jgi:hypothetical protein
MTTFGQVAQMITSKQRSTRWENINRWSIKGPLFAVALLLGFFDHALHCRAAFVAALAILVPILGFRDLWNDTKFWMMLLLLGVLQVALVYLANPYLERLSFIEFFPIAILNCVVVVSAMSAMSKC